MGTSSLLERGAMVLMSVSAVVLAITAIRQGGGATVPGPQGRTTEEAPARIDDWQELVESARLIDGANREVRLLVFSDLECTACAMLHDNLAAMDSTRRAAVSVAFLHYPLSSHRFARQAAHAAECAAVAGRFGEFIATTYDRQSRIGLDGWGDFAMRAGVPDTSAFVACVRSGHGSDRIDRHRALGDRLPLRYTPTVIVEGWQLVGTPSVDELSRVVDSLVAGRSPFSSEL